MLLSKSEIMEKFWSVAVLGVRIWIRRFRMFLGLQDPDPDPLVRGTDPDPAQNPFLF
jgi:hypothetical protein